jgi:hypothetical protein
MLTSRSESAASFESNDSTLSRRDSEIIFTPYKADYRFVPMVDTKVELNRYAEKSNPVHKQSI